MGGQVDRMGWGWERDGRADCERSGEDDDVGEGEGGGEKRAESEKRKAEG